jgi:outer membrane protein W
MKKCIVVLVMVIGMTASAFSAGMDIGVHVGMGWWMPFFADTTAGINSFNKLVRTKGSTYTMDPTWLVGADVGFRFTDAITWKNKYTFSMYNAKASYKQVWVYYPTFFNASQDIMKHDLDSTLGYRLHKHVEVLAGFLYQNYTDKRNDLGIFIGGPIVKTSWENVNNGLGGAVGVGTNFTLRENFRLNFNVRFIYMKPLLTLKEKGIEYIFPINITREPDYNSVGMDADLSFAYFITKASLTLALGCKYQYLYTLGSNPAYRLFDVWPMGFYWDMVPDMKKKHDHQINLYLSVVYNLNFPGKK